MNKRRFAKTPQLMSIVLSGLISVGCAAQDTPMTDDPDTAASPETTTKVVRMMNREEQILFARNDLSKKMQLELDEVSLSGAGKVTWRSGALGCPEEGQRYTQALVPGVLIMLKVENKPYRYHATPTGVPFYCSDDNAESPSHDSSDI